MVSVGMDAEHPAPASYRRAPFRSTSVLRAAGEQSRLDILTAAREVFGERGFHAATVEEIAGRCGRTGASVYQYFSGKAEIFRVFVDELGLALLRHARTLEPVTPDEAGRLRLGGWLGGLEEILDSHALTFSLWSAVEGDELSLVGPAQSFVETWTRVLAPAVGVPRSSGLPYALLAVSENVWEHQQPGGARADRGDLHAALTTYLHRAICSQPVRAGRLPAAPELVDPGWPGLRRPAGPRAVRSLERMVGAASRLMALQGVDATSMAEIAEHAGVRPASLYTYWLDKTHLLATMSTRADPYLVSALDAADVLEPDPAHLASWVGGVVRDYGHVAAVLRWWLSEAPGTTDVDRRRAELQRRGARAVERLLRTSTTPPFASESALLVLISSTLAFPRNVMLIDRWSSGAEVVATMTRLLGSILWEPSPPAT